MADANAIKAFASLIASLQYDQIRHYRPYGHPETLRGSWSRRPWQLNFHAAGLHNQERMLIAANRVGKTRCAAAEIAYHMTGDYPAWWPGFKMNKPALIWTGSPTNETSRDIVQKELLGGTDKETQGTGMIPRAKIIGKPRLRQAGVSDVVDTFKVRHRSGGISQCVLKTYEQGWRKWQGTQPGIVWLDEEPEDYRIYTESLTRLLTSRGRMMVTFTPLLGITDLVEHYQSGGPGIWMEHASWDDAPHLNEEDKARMRLSYPSHELEARTLGVPMMGEGRIFSVPETELVCEPFDIPWHWPQLKGVDFGLDHPAGYGRIAWDRDRDIIYITDAWKKRVEDSSEHAELVNREDPWIPVAWPHDGGNREKGSGRRLKDIWVDEYGVKMLGKSARYDNDKAGGQPQWPIIETLRDRERRGGLQIWTTCTAYLEERRNYHTRDGKIVSKRDDCLKAVFYAMMMLRYAATHRTSRHPVSGPPQQPVFRT